MSFFIEMINVSIGESYILNFANDKKMVRILVDGGSEDKGNSIEELILTIKSSEWLKFEGTEAPEGKHNKINGIIVTHIDDDHIGGIIKLLNHVEVEKYIDFSQECFIIFNDLVDSSTISYKQGKRLKEIIDKYPNLTLVRSFEQNRKFDINGFEIFIRNNKLKPITNNTSNIILIDILLPEKETLRKLMKSWLVEKKNSKLINQSSLVCIVQYEEKSVLLSADNFIPTIVEYLKSIDYKNKIDLMKLAHHGAFSNNKDILDLSRNIGVTKFFLPITIPNKYHPSSSILRKVLEEQNNEIIFPKQVRCKLGKIELDVNISSRILYKDKIDI